VKLQRRCMEVVGNPNGDENHYGCSDALVGPHGLS